MHFSKGPFIYLIHFSKGVVNTIIHFYKGLFSLHYTFSREFYIFKEKAIDFG